MREFRQWAFSIRQFFTTNYYFSTVSLFPGGRAPSECFNRYQRINPLLIYRPAVLLDCISALNSLALPPPPRNVSLTAARCVAKNGEIGEYAKSRESNSASPLVIQYVVSCNREPNPYSYAVASDSFFFPRIATTGPEGQNNARSTFPPLDSVTVQPIVTVTRANIAEVIAKTAQTIFLR